MHEQLRLRELKAVKRKAEKAAREEPSGEGDQPMAKKKKVNMFDEFRTQKTV